MKSLVLSALAATLVSADWYNNVPVPGKRPAFVTGSAKQGIDFEIVYDLMCSDSAYLDPYFQQFLNMTWNVTNDLVKNSVKVSYTFLPLPYHHEVWIPHLLVPWFLDQCDFSQNCLFPQYLQYCFANQDSILDAKDSSFNQIVANWTSQIATAFSLNQTELLQVYNEAKDTHDSEWRTRLMYKWNTHHHVSGTPFGFVNGILMENFPESTKEWMDLLTTVYNSQYRPPKASSTDL